ncbi:MFS transporter [Planomonospora sp. ID67723]|uniref:MFS transporter n=1 Tax=Planomonospora sp. ID67723 TaxID=2738134 RepID=UPI0018C3E719|nr:MFS transporter [Planomonospora sp. ID67723]MBG0827523.1 MFS transporter [Planomonospora sp. ID67723]
MIISSSRAPGARAKRLAATLYVYTFLDDLILLYPVYALLFAETGLSVTEISSLFVIWSVTGILLEVPSGVWADAVSRRLLLCLAPLPAAAGYALWVAAPSYWAFALGFVLWGVRGAMGSGAFEALAYEELDRLGAADTYIRVIGRAEVAGLCGVGVATATAGPVFAAGGYPALGAASVIACLLCAAAGMALPEHRSPASPDGQGADAGDGGPGGYAAILRAGLAAARGDRAVRRALLLIPAVTAVWGALEEYVALLVAETGVAAQAVPLWVLLVWVGVTAGGFLAPAGRRLTTRALAWTLALAAFALASGTAGGHPAGLVLVAAAFCVFQMTSVVVDARLQERIAGPSRATVTSMANLGTDLVTVLVYGGYAAASAFAGHGLVFALFAVPYLLLALVLGYGGRAREVAGGTTSA